MTDDTRLDARVRSVLTDLPVPDDDGHPRALVAVLERSQAGTAKDPRPWLVPRRGGRRGGHRRCVGHRLRRPVGARAAGSGEPAVRSSARWVAPGLPAPGDPGGTASGG